MIINDNSVEQINVVLLDIDKKLKTTSVTSAQVQQIQKQLDNIQRTLRETAIGLSSGATYNINITGNASSASFATEAGSAKVTATAQSAEIANYANTAGSATTATSATTAQSAERADEANHAKLADNISAGGTSGQVLTSNGPSAAPSWQDQKSIMKPNYTTGKLPAGTYKGGQTVSVSASITTTRGNPVFISYSGDFNSVGAGNTVPLVWFKLYVDGQIVQTTTVDNSAALESDNTAFAGNALAALSAGNHTIRLDAELNGNASGQVQFQEQDNIVNLVAFEL